MNLRIAYKINTATFRCSLCVVYQRYNNYMIEKAISTISKRTHKWKRKHLKD